jgi:hypothetical protein
MSTKNPVLLFTLLFFLMSCSKEETQTIDQPVDTENSSILFAGEFKSEVHTTSGKVSVVQQADKKLMLKIENLSSDSGPDLRLWVAESKNAQSSIEITTAPKNGTYLLQLPENINFNSKKFVLIWCKKFGVLFGSAELKPQ